MFWPAVEIYESMLLQRIRINNEETEIQGQGQGQGQRQGQSTHALMQWSKSEAGSDAEIGSRQFKHWLTSSR